MSIDVHSNYGNYNVIDNDFQKGNHKGLPLHTISILIYPYVSAIYLADFSQPIGGI